MTPRLAFASAFGPAFGLAFGLALVTAAAPSSPPAPAPPPRLDRAHCERVVRRAYPGFRILGPADYSSPDDGFVDGERGGLVVGNLDLDTRPDFAAYIVPPRPKRYEVRSHGYAVYGYDYYEGYYIVCHALPDGLQFTCDAKDLNITLPMETILERVPPGRHECPADDEHAFVVTYVDSVSRASEKGGRFSFLRPDGTTGNCTTGD
jgi:hypothetical protein